MRCDCDALQSTDGYKVTCTRCHMSYGAKDYLIVELEETIKKLKLEIKQYKKVIGQGETNVMQPKRVHKN